MDVNRESELEELVLIWRKGGEARRSLVSRLAVAGVANQVQELMAGPVEARRLLVSILSIAPSDPSIAGVLRTLATDPDRQTRAAAARGLGALLTQVPDVYPLFLAWCDDPTPRVRRAVALAAAAAAKQGHPGFAEPLLALIEPLLPDRTEEVKRVVGPKVLACDFFSVYPDETFEHIVDWSTSQDAQVLWNVAMALSGSGIAGYLRKALIVLRRLSLDERRYVRGAVIAALRRLSLVRPDVVTAELTSWLTDEERAWVAQAALRLK